MIASTGVPDSEVKYDKILPTEGRKVKRTSSTISDSRGRRTKSAQGNSSFNKSASSRTVPHKVSTLTSHV